ncbi:MAG: poly-gamma-glutamate hydrolase family protein [Deltaproteobacteria bacterium]|nr:poly-gamma-glutamate hydrolase family protein [Deltaproteobacteria bacterium]
MAVVESLQLRGPLGVLAPHGGGIEPGTEAIARFVASESGASLYVFSGRLPSGNRALHCPSHQLEPDRHPLLEKFINHVSLVLSIHGHGRSQRQVYVGGLNKSLLESLADLLRHGLPEYEWISDWQQIPSSLRGRDPNNIVNLAPSKGIQLELPLMLRQTTTGNKQERSVPAGDAMVLSQMLVEFVRRWMAGKS